MIFEQIQEFKEYYGKHWINDASMWAPSVGHSKTLPPLTDEQQKMVDLAMQGKNVFVDACVGSGKTTSIQALCNAYDTGVKILYLTYSKLLKCDAREKIKKKGVTVTNYHGFAYMLCKKYGIKSGVSEVIKKVITNRLPIPYYNVLVIDEYQDIDQEMAIMLDMIKSANPGIQIVAVGDMCQKIRSNTRLDILTFIHGFLEEYEEVEFTRCFRLCDPQAKRLEKGWGKTITGVNENCKVTVMDRLDVVNFLKYQDPKDVLCLGQRYGSLSRALNDLEEMSPDRYNKHTIYASIRDRDGQTMEPDPDCGIFTTYDSCKGLERKICVLFDYVPSYWEARIHTPDADYNILRNIFLVGASRGKELIIYVYDQNKKSSAHEEILTEDYILESVDMGRPFDVFNISDMYDFKYREDVEECFELLEIEEIRKACGPINIPMSDAMIDLSPCIGIYQEAMYFNGYNIDAEFTLLQETRPDIHVYHDPTDDLDHKILKLVALDTMQERYYKQVTTPFIEKEYKDQIADRLSDFLTADEDVQKPCRLTVSSKEMKMVEKHKSSLQHFEHNYSDDEELEPEHQFDIVGYCDVLKEDAVWELKFVNEVQHTHFLQCACYMFLLKRKEGYLYNTRDGSLYKITIKDREKFLQKTVETITKGVLTEFTTDLKFELKITEKRRKLQKKTMEQVG